MPGNVLDCESLPQVQSHGHPIYVFRFQALATDYDGTLATHGSVDPQAIAALKKLRDSGRALLLVTGRELPDLKRVFPYLDLFDRIVAENGALLYRPATRGEKLLCAPAADSFVDRLREMGVSPLSVGRAVVATTNDNTVTVQSVVNEMNLDLTITLNKGSMMVLPSGVDKRFGLSHALAELAIEPGSVVAIGDAENDHSFLSACGFGVAVANALPELKRCADMVTVGTHGAGVAEVIEHLLADDLASVDNRATREH